MRFLSSKPGSGAWAALAAVGIAFCLGLTTPAQANSCSALKSQLASLNITQGDPAQFRKFAGAAERQASEVQKAERRYRSSGCTRNNSPQCRSFAATLEKMKTNLSRLNSLRERYAGKTVSSSRKRQLEAQVRDACRHTVATTDNGSTGSTRNIISARGNADRGQQRTSLTVTPNTVGDYRTLCVRACDGYFFPISYAATKENFERDAAVCQAMCPAADVKLFSHRNWEEDIENMVALDGENYISTPTAFAYRTTKRDAACSCGKPDTAALGILGLGRRIGENDTVVQEVTKPQGPIYPAPGNRPDLAADRDSQMARTGDLDMATVSNLLNAVSTGQTYDLAITDRSVRVVLPEFLPDPATAIDLQAPGPTAVQ